MPDYHTVHSLCLLLEPGVRVGNMKPQDNLFQHKNCGLYLCLGQVSADSVELEWYLKRRHDGVPRLSWRACLPSMVDELLETTGRRSFCGCLPVPVRMYGSRKSASPLPCMNWMALLLQVVSSSLRDGGCSALARHCERLRRQGDRCALATGRMKGCA